MEVLISTAFPAALIDFERQLLFSPGKSDLSGKIQIPGSKQAGVDIAVQGAPSDHELALVVCHDTVDGLALFHQGGDKSVNPMDFMFRQSNPGMGFRPQSLVFFLGSNRFVDPLLQRAYSASGTPVAHIGRLAEKAAFFSGEFPADRIAKLFAAPAFPAGTCCGGAGA